MRDLTIGLEGKEMSHKEPESAEEIELRQVLAAPANSSCADCGAKYPRFASITLAVFLCNRCYGIHRRIGAHITRTKCIGLDKWTPQEVHRMRTIGNAIASSYWECNVPQGSPRLKPTPDSSNEAVEAWIRDKYERKLFCPRDLPAPQAPEYTPRRPRLSVKRPSLQSQNMEMLLPGIRASLNAGAGSSSGRDKGVDFQDLLTGNTDRNVGDRLVESVSRRSSVGSVGSLGQYDSAPSSPAPDTGGRRALPPPDLFSQSGPPTTSNSNSQPSPSQPARLQPPPFNPGQRPSIKPLPKSPDDVDSDDFGDFAHAKFET